MGDKRGKEFVPLDQAVETEAQDSPPPFEEIFSGAAVFTNRTYVTLVPPLGVRLTFMEGSTEIGGGEKFRVAVHMSVLDAMALRDVLANQLDKIRVKLEQAAEEAAEAEDQA